MQKQKQKKKTKGSKKSFFLILGIVLILGSMAITIVSTQLKIRERKKVRDEKQQAYESQIHQNDRLQAVLDSDDKSSYLEQKAREQGFVMPGEKVFYDVTPGE